ncbi:single-stranded DNA-binding protein [Cupriavidus taiwanensis]|uniref:Single-stranded DNA-binding protein n=1 Tax=Cupriavidus taiwanensis TaxID=164546 RepID=A0A976A2U4_9BURK|nr:conserved hypothetical protein [Cupriavidus taiwanensis]
MSIDVLVSGRLVGTASERQGRDSGKRFVSARLRVPGSDGESILASVVAFSDTVGAALLALADGDAVSLAGSAKLTAWMGRTSGKPEAGLDLVAHAVLSAYHVRRKRAAVVGEDDPEPVSRPRRSSAGHASGRGTKDLARIYPPRASPGPDAGLPDGFDEPIPF